MDKRFLAACAADRLRLAAIPQKQL